MDNVVQNISISSIIPSNSGNDDPRQLEELANSIKNYGILEPILVRPKSGKYEIIIGNKRYQAARMLGLKDIPALVKNIDDEVFNQYKAIDNFGKKQQKHGKFINPVNDMQTEISTYPKQLKNQNTIDNNLRKSENITSNATLNNMNRHQNFFELPNVMNKRNQNSDIMNLSELNKEYERDDLKMNNEQMNNNLTNNNIGVSPVNPTPTPQEPTFGGRFFPSLEDEPANMNIGVPSNSTSPTQEQSLPNNLIDLTDIGSEHLTQPTIPNSEISPSPAEPTPIQPSVNPAPMMNTQMNIPTQTEPVNPIPNPMDNVISIDNLQNQNPPVDIPSMNVGPTMNPSPTSPIIDQQPVPQFDMSQNIAPIEFTQSPEPIPTPMQPIQQPETMVQPTMGSINIEPQVATPTYNQMAEPQVTPIIPEQPTLPPKDLTPVLNTIKELVSNLEAFGYKMNVSEQDLGTTIKLSIEVEK